MKQAERMGQLLNLRCPPVAIKFQSSPPADLPRIDATAVSSCGYWKLAAQGRTFYTEAADHYGCPIGAYTHGIELPEDVAAELTGLVDTMLELQYLQSDEVAEIPQLERSFGVAIYAPLSQADFAPDVVVVVGRPKQMMLLAEAAHAAGVSGDASAVGRPTCSAIPAVLQSHGIATNLGCIGNRIYTELPDDELVCVISGEQLDSIVKKLEAIVHANGELAAFHQGRAAAAT